MEVDNEGKRIDEAELVDEAKRIDDEVSWH